MVREIEIEIEKLLSIMPIGREFTTKWFKDTLSVLYNRPRDSYITSDYCYNIKNNGINWATQPHYFKALEHGKYRYVGKDYKEKI